MIRDAPRRRRAHRAVVHAVGEPRLARRPDPAAAGVRAPAPRAGAELRAGRERRPLRQAGRTATSRGSGSGGWAPARSSTSPAPTAERWWREQVKRVLEQGVEGIKVDDGDGYYLKDDVRLADGRTRRRGRLAARRAAPASACSARSTRSIPAAGCCSGARAGSASTRSATPGPPTRPRTSGRCGRWWSRRCRRPPAASPTGHTTSAATWGTGWSSAARPSCCIRWLQFGCFTPLMQAHSRLPHEPWNYGERMVDTYRAYVLLHEQLVPYVRAAAATAARDRAADHPAALPDRPERPARLGADRRLRLRPGAVGRAGARRRRARARGPAAARRVDRDLVRAARRRRPGGRRARAASQQIPVWVRAGAIVVTYPAEHVARGLGDTPESERPLEATLWGSPDSRPGDHETG